VLLEIPVGWKRRSMLEECMGVGKERQVVVENIRRTGGVGKERNRIGKRVRGVREGAWEY